MENGNYVTISLERYEQLIRSEHDANQLKTLIANRASNYEGLDYVSIIHLHTLYNGNEEETK